jgi:Cysteine rich repeat
MAQLNDKSNIKFAVTAAVAGLLLSIAAGSSANAQYRGTPEMQQACTPDVMRLCNDDVPDVDKIVACMKRNRANLSPACGAVFGAGLSRREGKRH